MAPILSFLISSGSKKKGAHICMSEAKTSQSHKMWTEVSSSVPHFLQMGLLLSPITYNCLLKVLCPLSRPITILDCILLKDNNRALVARSGPEISLEPVSVNYKDHVTILDAGFRYSVSSFLLYSAQRPLTAEVTDIQCCMTHEEK